MAIKWADPRELEELRTENTQLKQRVGALLGIVRAVAHAESHDELYRAVDDARAALRQGGGGSDG